MSRLRTALVGFGYAGQTFHAPLIAATGGLTLTHVVSSNAQKVRAHWPDVTIVADLDAVLIDPTVDLVVIATPNHTHADMARRALRAGKHVVVDKPFTVSLDDARDVAAVAEQSGKILSIFHNRRWDADFLTLSQLIRQGDLGRVTQFESHFDRFRPVPRDRWRERADVPGAGLWHDLGPHLLDQVLCLFGRPISIFADIGTQRTGNGAPDYFHAILRYDNGLRAIVHGSMLTADSSLRFAVHGDGGSFIKHGLDSQEDMLKTGAVPGGHHWGIDPSPGRLVTLTDQGTNVARPVSGIAGDYRHYYAAVAAAINRTSPNPVCAEDAIQVMELIAAGYRSTREGRAIRL